VEAHRVPHQPRREPEVGFGLVADAVVQPHIRVRERAERARRGVGDHVPSLDHRLARVQRLVHPLQECRVHPAVRVEHYDRIVALGVCQQPLEQPAQRIPLPPSLALTARVDDRPCALRGRRRAVAAVVRHHVHVERLRRVLALQQPLDRRRDHRFFVVRRQRDRQPHRALRRAWAGRAPASGRKEEVQVRQPRAHQGQQERQDRGSHAGHLPVRIIFNLQSTAKTCRNARRAPRAGLATPDRSS